VHPYVEIRMLEKDTVCFGSSFRLYNIARAAFGDANSWQCNIQKVFSLTACNSGVNNGASKVGLFNPTMLSVFII
jgi:hypothetical protein